MKISLSPEQRLASLSSTSKWFLGGGRRLLWAPEFPVCLHRPGFWDHGTYLELKLEGLLTYALLENGAELTINQTSRNWRPDLLTAEYVGAGLEIAEARSVTIDDAFRSELRVKNTTRRARTIDLVLWARVDVTDVNSPRFVKARAAADGVSGEYQTFDREGKPEHAFKLSWTLTRPNGAGKCASYAVMTSEPGGKLADWRLTPFYEIFDDGLPNTCVTTGGIDGRQPNPMGSAIFIGLHQRLKLRPNGSTTYVGQCQATPTVPARPAARKLPDWNGFFAQAPVFQCSDPYLQKYYDYRWYGLRANAADAGVAPLRHPCVFEGINHGWFRHAISYSAQVLPRDCRWLHDPTLAQGCILNFLEEQRKDGFIHGGLLTGAQSRTRHTGHMYHCDWGGVVRAVCEIHPDRKFLSACYEPLCRNVEFFDKQRDKEKSGLYDVCSQGDTGQEYMSRYLFVDKRADEWGQIQLKGVDATTYIYELQRNLAWMAEQLKQAREAARWRKAAERTRAALLSRMWDAKRRKFCDVHPKTGRRSPVRALTDFYPFMTDIPQPEHVAAIREHLLDPAAFWTPYPAPSTALDDPLADSDGRWRGKRMNCPWNGRTWLMSNSHVAEALANAALTLDRGLERYAVEFIRKFVHMLFVDHDLAQPTSYEYYNPLTGQAPFFRGTEEYMHSWIIDLLIKYAAGLRPQADGVVVVEPLDFGLKEFSLTNCVVAGQAVEVTWNGKTLTAKVGKRRQSVTGLGRIVFER